MENPIEQFKTEEQLQSACYLWFDNTYPEYRGCLFAVPNGGTRVGREGNTFKATGVRAGVSDLIWVLPLEVMFIEIKFGSGVQSDHQIIFQRLVEKHGHQYHIFYSLWKWKEFAVHTIKQYYGK